MASSLSTLIPDKNTYWGFSKPLDLYEEYITYIDGRNIKNKELNILLFGNVDSRNILKTTSKFNKTRTTQINTINIYAIDNSMEIIAKNMLLLLLAFENSNYVTTHDKVHIYLDIYGNTMLRPISNRYIINKSKILYKMLNNSAYMKNIAPIFNIDLLTYREHDKLEDIFKFWTLHDLNNDNTINYWDLKLRENLGSRYDNRYGIFDWDYSMYYKSINNEINLNLEEYRNWRENGIAFLYTGQTLPNRTLCNRIEKNGLKYDIESYSGDIICGPFNTYGYELSYSGLVKSTKNNCCEYSSKQVAELNLFQIMHYIQNLYGDNNKSIEHNLNHINNSNDSIVSSTTSNIVTTSTTASTITIDNISTSSALVRINDDNTSGSDSGRNYDEQRKFDSVSETRFYDRKMIDIDKPKIQINFLTFDTFLKTKTIQKELQNYFNIVFISNQYFSKIYANFLDVCRDDIALVIFETKLFEIPNKNVNEHFTKLIKDYAKAENLQNVSSFNINCEYSLIKYIRRTGRNPQDCNLSNDMSRTELITEKNEN